MNMAQQLRDSVFSLALVLLFSGIAAGQSIIWNDIEKSAPWLRDSQPYSAVQWEKTENIVTNLVFRHYRAGSFSDTEIAQLANAFSGSNVQADWVWFNTFKIFFLTSGLFGDQEFRDTASRFRIRLVESLKSNHSKAIRFYQLQAQYDAGWWGLPPARVDAGGLLNQADKIKTYYRENAPVDKYKVSFDALQLFLVMVAFEKNDGFPDMDQLMQKPSLLGKTAEDLVNWYSQNGYRLLLRQDQKTFRTTMLSGYIAVAAVMVTAAVESLSSSGNLENFGDCLLTIYYNNRIFVWRRDEHFFERNLPEMDVELLHIRIGRKRRHQNP